MSNTPIKLETSGGEVDPGNITILQNIQASPNTQIVTQQGGNQTFTITPQQSTGGGGVRPAATSGANIQYQQLPFFQAGAQFGNGMFQVVQPVRLQLFIRNYLINYQ